MSWRPHTIDHCLRHLTITKYPSVSASWLALSCGSSFLSPPVYRLSLNYMMVAAEFYFALTLSAGCSLRMKAFIQASTMCFLSFWDSGFF